MTSEEFEELFSQLRKAGYEPRLDDEYVPTFLNPVHCGPASEVGDIECENDGWCSRDSIERNKRYKIPAIGDSMQDADIYAGDMLTVQSGITPMDGDILLVRHGDRFTIKAYYEDEDGVAWLVPYNDNYEAIKVGNGAEYVVCGRVVQVTKMNPRVKSRESQRRVRKVKDEKKRMITPELVESVIFDVSPMIKNGRQWYAVFRKLVELTVYGMAEIEAFCTKVVKTVPNHKYLPIPSELQRMAVQSFTRPSKLWEENDAPVTGKRFFDYVRIADRTEELMEAA